MMKKIKIKSKKKRFEISLKVCNWFETFSGLMFTRREKAQALLFGFDKPVKLKIHSLFVFFPFVALWLDKDNNIVDKKLVNPFNFSVSSRKPYFRLVEIPINQKYSSITKFIVEDSKV